MLQNIGLALKECPVFQRNRTEIYAEGINICRHFIKNSDKLQVSIPFQLCGKVSFHVTTIF